MKNWKYKLEENKDKFLLGGIGVVAIAGIGLGVIYLNSESQAIDKKGGTVETKLADALVFKTNEGDLGSFDMSKKSITAQLKLDEKDLIGEYNTGNQLYVYQNEQKSFSQVSVAQDKMSLTKVHELKDDSKTGEVLSFHSTLDNVFIRAEKGYFILNKSQDLVELDKTIFENAKSTLLTSEGLYSSTGNEIHFIDLNGLNKRKINLQDDVYHLTEKGDSVYAYSNFGSGVKKQMLVKINDGSLELEKVMKISGTKMSPTLSASDESQLTTFAYGDKKVTSVSWDLEENGSALTSEPEVKAVNEILDVDSKVTSSKGHLYYVEGEEIKVYQTRNTQSFEPYTISNIAEGEFVFPAFYN